MPTVQYALRIVPYGGLFADFKRDESTNSLMQSSISAN